MRKLLDVEGWYTNRERQIYRRNFSNDAREKSQLEEIIKEFNSCIIGTNNHITQINAENNAEKANTVKIWLLLEINDLSDELYKAYYKCENCIHTSTSRYGHARISAEDEPICLKHPEIDIFDDEKETDTCFEANSLELKKEYKARYAYLAKRKAEIRKNEI